MLDADLIARDVVEPGTDGLAAVVTTFGRQVLGADGALTAARWVGPSSATRLPGSG